MVSELILQRVLKEKFENKVAVKDFTDPTENPTLTLDCAGRATVEFWVTEPTGGITVNIYGSTDNATWRFTTSYTTDPTTKTATDVLSLGYRYIKVEIVNTAPGSYRIEISASR